MTLKKILKTILIILAAIILLVLIFVAISVAPVNQTPAKEYSSYAETMHRLDSIDKLETPEALHGIFVGFAKVSLTPVQRTALSGYGNRRGKLFSFIHDSIYVRSIVVDNGVKKVAIVSADLLIIPPTVTELLESKLNKIGFGLQNTYLGATHTHNSIGNWGEGATRFIYGTYQDSIVHFIADQIVLSIQSASSNMAPATIRWGNIPVPHAVNNRLIKDGPEDPLLRAVEFHRNDSAKLVLLSYTAHATCLHSRDLELSRDYPGVLVDTLEKKDYDFAMFLAGAVGSHKCSPPSSGWDCTQWMAGELKNALLSSRDQFEIAKDSAIQMFRVSLTLSEPQVKITSNWKVRPWLFRSAFGEYPSYLSALRIGRIVMLGTPCDFSGEFNPGIDSLAAAHQLNAIVTSFNGGYIGYVTPSKYYNVNHYETQLMNWYAPGTGEYIEECLGRLILSVEK